MSSYTPPSGMAITGAYRPEFADILTPEALSFIAKLQREFNPRRKELLQRRQEVQAQIDAGQLPDFLPETADVRNGDWQVGPTPEDLQQRWTEITGPTDRKMLINALNSGADVFMADLEDANAPNWFNMVDGQINLGLAIDRTIDFTSPEGKTYSLNDNIATLMVRPRGWHLNEKHVTVDGEPMSGSLFDFGLYFFHNAKKLLDNGSGPYFYLAKLENHLEARLWNDVFVLAQSELGLPNGTIKATVLLETVLASFEMPEIIYELRDHSAGLNAGRWDYIFSVIKKFRNRPGFLLPDRAQITMTTSFMRAYTEYLVQSCHKHGAHAMGGMAAFIPNRRDPEITEAALAKVRADKEREANDGFDGTWVAHPDLVPVARQVFEDKLGGKANQKERQREDVVTTPADLMSFTIPDGTITEAGVRLNINVGLLYLSSWLNGNGAAAIYNLMEDAATAEISRTQLWQWLHNDDATLPDGRKVDLAMYQAFLPEELAKIKAMLGDEAFAAGRFDDAEAILTQVATADDFIDFLTLVAYDYID